VADFGSPSNYGWAWEDEWLASSRRISVSEPSSEDSTAAEYPHCYWLLSYPTGQNREQGGRKRIDPAEAINGKKKIAVRLAVPEAEQEQPRMVWRGVAAAVNPWDGGRTIG
jgi:hypothetical protein